jgi:hypothetical protein
MRKEIPGRAGGRDRDEADFAYRRSTSCSAPAPKTQADDADAQERARLAAILLHVRIMAASALGNPVESLFAKRLLRAIPRDLERAPLHRLRQAHRAQWELAKEIWALSPPPGTGFLYSRFRAPDGSRWFKFEAFDLQRADVESPCVGSA